MLITAFALSLLFMVSGALGARRGHATAWEVMASRPGFWGFTLALMSLCSSLLPTVHVVSFYLALLSCVATVSMVVYIYANWIFRGPPSDNG